MSRNCGCKKSSSRRSRPSSPKIHNCPSCTCKEKPIVGRLREKLELKLQFLQSEMKRLAGASDIAEQLAGGDYWLEDAGDISKRMNELLNGKSVAMLPVLAEFCDKRSLKGRQFEEIVVTFKNALAGLDEVSKAVDKIISKDGHIFDELTDKITRKTDALEEDMCETTSKLARGVIVTGKKNKKMGKCGGKRRVKRAK